MQNLHFPSGKMRNSELAGVSVAERNSGELTILHFPARKVKVLHVHKVFHARDTLRTCKTLSFLAGKWQKYNFGRIPVATRIPPKLYFCHFPARKLKVLHVRKVSRA